LLKSLTNLLCTPLSMSAWKSRHRKHLLFLPQFVCRAIFGRRTFNV
jgi:hypothetical protein